MAGFDALALQAPSPTQANPIAREQRPQEQAEAFINKLIPQLPWWEIGQKTAINLQLEAVKLCFNAKKIVVTFTCPCLKNYRQAMIFFNLFNWDHQDPADDGSKEMLCEVFAKLSAHLNYHNPIDLIQKLTPVSKQSELWFFLFEKTAINSPELLQLTYNNLKTPDAKKRIGKLIVKQLNKLEFIATAKTDRLKSINQENLKSIKNTFDADQKEWEFLLSEHALPELEIQYREFLKQCQNNIRKVKNIHIQITLAQIVQRNLQEPDSAEAFIKTASKFNKQPLFGIVFAENGQSDTPAFPENDQITLNFENASEESKAQTLENFLFFQLSYELPYKDRYKLIKIALLPSNHSLEEISSALKVIALICNDASSPLECFYNKLASSCESIDDILKAKNLDAEFFYKIIEKDKSLLSFLDEVIYKQRCNLYNQKTKLLTKEEYIELVKIIFRSLGNLSTTKESPTELVSDFLDCQSALKIKTKELTTNKYFKNISDGIEDSENATFQRWAVTSTILSTAVPTDIIQDDFFIDTLKQINSNVRSTNTKLLITHLWFNLAIHNSGESYHSFKENFEQFNTSSSIYKKILSIPLVVVSAPLSNDANQPTIHEALEEMEKLANHRIHKDGKKLCLLLDTLCCIIFNQHLDNSQKIKLLQKCAKPFNSSLKETISMAYKNLMAAKVCLRLIESFPENSTIQDYANKLQTEEQPADLIKTLLKELLGTQENLDALGDNYMDYRTSAREPNALLDYFSSLLRNIPNIDEQQTTQKTFPWLLKALSKPHQAFALRYKPCTPFGNNTHIKELEKFAPLAWQEWQQPAIWEQPIDYSTPLSLIEEMVNPTQYLHDRIVKYRHVPEGTFPALEAKLKNLTSTPHNTENTQTLNTIETNLLEFLMAQETNSSECLTSSLQQLQAAINNIDQSINQSTTDYTQFRQDLVDLQSKLTAKPVTKEKAERLKIGINANSEDLLLCGTEIKGSCQNIYTGEGFNEALVCYVLDGKYQMAQITQANGALMARRMLRLLWSEAEQKPVIHIEMEYSNPGVPAKTKAIMVRLIYEKAQAMDAMLATNDTELLRQLNVGNNPAKITLNAYASPYPHEYVDALGGIQNYGEYTVDATLLPDKLPQGWPQ